MYSGRATINRIIPHCVVGQVTMKRLGEIFQNPNREASSNYGCCIDGIGMYVEEKNTSWATSSYYCDSHGISIECASDSKAPYAFTDKVWNELVDLCTDICKRYGKTTLMWISDKWANRYYEPKEHEMLLSAHRFYSSKSCPGDWMFEREQKLCNEVNLRLREVPWGIRDFTKELYTYVLERDAQQRELNYWNNKMLNGMTASEVAREFFNGSEYKSYNRTDYHFVRDLYQGLLRREPEQNGYKFWMGKLAAGESREDVLEEIFKSKEFKEFCKHRNIKP